MSKNLYGNSLRATTRTGAQNNPHAARLSKGLGPTSWYKADQVAQSTLRVRKDESIMFTAEERQAIIDRVRIDTRYRKVALAQGLIEQVVLNDDLIDWIWNQK